MPYQISVQLTVAAVVVTALLGVVRPVCSTSMSGSTGHPHRPQQPLPNNDVNHVDTADTGRHLVVPPESPVAAIPSPVKVRQCEPIRIETCMGLGYNVTGFPNLVGHDVASDAEQQLRTFQPLIQYSCSLNGELRMFLCAVYIPMCTEQYPEVIGPCRSVCERVRRQCEPVLQNFGFPWPTALQCDHFHARNNVDDQMCMEGPGTAELGDDDPVTPPNLAVVAPKMPVDISKKCVTGDGKRNPPDNATSAASPTELIRVWTCVWSVPALLSAIFVVVTFAVDTSRYSFADRTVLLTATCSAVCAVGHLSRLVVGGAVDGTSRASASSADSASHASSSVDELLGPCDGPTRAPRLTEPPSDCTVAYVVVYYFATASMLWWLVLTLVWALQTGRTRRHRWTDAELSRRMGTWFHLVAWSVPAVATIVMLVRKDVVVEVMTAASDVSFCRVPVGSGSGLGLVLVPKAAGAAFGIVLLVVGAVRYRVGRRQRPANGGLVDKNAELLKQQQRMHDVTSENPPTAAAPFEPGDSQTTEIGLRIGVIGFVGAVGLLVSVVCLAHEHARRSSDGVPTSSLASLLVGILTSVLMAFVVGPWLVMTGQASGSWSGVIVRHRRDRKCPSSTDKPSPPSTSSSSYGQQHCHQCKPEMPLSSGSRLPPRPVKCRPLSAVHDGHDGEDEAVYQLWRQFPVALGDPVIATTTSPKAKTDCNVNNGYCNPSTKTGTGYRPPPSSSGGSKSIRIDGSVRRCRHELYRHHNQRSSTRSSAGIPSPPPGSRCTVSQVGSAGRGDAWSDSSSVTGLGSGGVGFSVTCQFCRRQHHLHHPLVI